MARYQKKKNNPNKTIVFLLLLIATAVLSLIGFNPNESLLLVLAIGLPILFVVLVIGLVISLPSTKGNYGERKIARIIDKVATEESKIIHDVTIVDAEGKSSQIDHILISPSGIHVIETKNLSGRIYGNETQQEWTQVLQFGNTKKKIYNPIKQNKTHIYRLSNILNTKSHFYSYVVFVQGNIEFIDARGIYTPYSLAMALQNNESKNLSKSKIDSYYSLIQSFKDYPIVSMSEHVSEIKKAQLDIENNICPRCGGSLVMRKSKDGNTFYGCSNYPNCRFTKRS
jgi:ribosomal protein S27AE